MAGSTKRRDELISVFSGKLFSAMLEEVIMDAALQSHKDVIRGRTACPVCGTRCSSVHTQGDNAKIDGASTSALTSSIPRSAPTSPPSTSIGTSTPATKEKSDGNIYFECTNCQKKIASNRYAPHLSGCLGIGTGSRRGAARNAAAKNKLGAEVDRGVSPLIASDDGSLSHETINGRGKAKGFKKTNAEELNGNNKRPSKHDGAPAKKNKKQKASTAGSDVTMLVDDSNGSKPHPPTPAKVSTKAGANSPHVPGSPSVASGSQYSIRDSPSASASHSASSMNARSPSASFVSRAPKSYKMTSGKKRGRPTSSGKSQAVVTEMTLKQKAEGKEVDLDFVDVDGEGQEQDSSDSS